MKWRLGALLAAGAVALCGSAGAAAGVFLSPTRAKTHEAEVFTLAVQSERSGERLPTALVELFVPVGFSIDAFAPTPGWEQDWTVQSSSDPAGGLTQKATWSREEEDLRDEHEREEASEQDAVFEFFGRATASKTFRFTVRQTYADGSVVQWGPRVRWPGGPPTSAGPAPAVVARSSLGGGTSAVELAALIVGALGLAAAITALLELRRRRTPSRLPT